jgi:hypothetical protein
MAGTSDHPFDAKTDAANVEHLAQVYLQALGDNKDSATTTYTKAAKKELMDALVPVFRDENHAKQLAVELEKLGAATFSFDPNVSVSRTNGEIDKIAFTKSGWNLSASKEEVDITTHVDASKTTFLDLSVTGGADTGESRPISVPIEDTRFRFNKTPTACPAQPMVVEPIPSGSYDGQVPVLHGDDRKPAPYQGGIGTDAPQLGQILKRMGPEASLAWDSFIKNYNDRSQESVLPRNLPLNEIDAPLKGKLSWYGPFADSDMSYVATPSGRDFKPYADTTPGSSKEAGHVYAIGSAKDAVGAPAPFAILDYESRDVQNPQYYGQYQFQYTNTSDCGLQVDITQWNPAKGNLYEPMTKDIAGTKHAMNGLTRYKFDAKGNLTSAEEYLAFNMNKPLVSLQFQNGSNGVDALTGQPLDAWRLKLASPKLMFFDLFGPKPD